MELPGYSFKIMIDSVMLLKFSQDVVNCGLKEMPVEDLGQFSQFPIEMMELRASNEDITLFQAAKMASCIAIPLTLTGGVAKFGTSGKMAGGGALGLATHAVAGIA